MYDFTSISTIVKLMYFNIFLRKNKNYNKRSTKIFKYEDDGPNNK